MKPLTNRDKKKIQKQLNQQFGIIKIPNLLIQFGQEKYHIFSGNLSKEELSLLDRTLNIENAGLNCIKKQGQEFSLTLDSLTLFKLQITKNIIELTENQTKQWLSGKDLNIQTISGWKVLKYKNELIGCAKSTNNILTNSIPKERRIEELN